MSAPDVSHRSSTLYLLRSGFSLRDLYDINNTSYAVPDLEGHIASGRAEKPDIFTKNSLYEFFVKKNKPYHAAAGESGFHLMKRLVCMSTA